MVIGTAPERSQMRRQKEWVSYDCIRFGAFGSYGVVRQGSGGLYACELRDWQLKTPVMRWLTDRVNTWIGELSERSVVRSLGDVAATATTTCCVWMETETTRPPIADSYYIYFQVNVPPTPFTHGWFFLHISGAPIPIPILSLPTCPFPFS